MHRCLQIPEVVANVASNLRSKPSWLPNEDLKSALNMALTCKSFREPALDELWSTLHSFIPLLRCFPSDIWTQEKPNPNLHRTIFTFLRAPYLGEWRRVLYYVSRVKSFHFGRFESLSKDALEILWLTRPSTLDFLFPTLQEVRLENEGIPTPYFRWLLPTSLRELSIVTRTSIGVSILYVLPDLCPSLLKLDIFSGRRDNAPTLSLQNIVGRFQNLTKLILPKISTQTLLATAALPLLEKLDATISADADDIWPPLIEDFPLLRTLVLTVATVAQATQALSRIASHHLESLTIVIQSSNNHARSWGLFFHQIRSFKDTLIYLDLEEDCPLDASLPMDPIGPDILCQLFAFEYLWKLHVTTASPLEFGDEFFRELSEAFPDLNRLTLRSHFIQRPNSSVSLPGLVPFIAAHPDLSYLAIHLDATITDLSLEEHPTDGIVANEIKGLELTNPPISDPVLVAAFVSALFPQLRWIGTSNTTIEEGAKWDEVNRLVEVYGCIRQWGP